MPFSKLFRIVLAFVLMTLPTLAGATMLNGTVTYRERLALPPDARLRVTLVDLTSGQRHVGATAGIPARGTVPIAFSLNVRSDLDSARAYGLVAEISSAGRVMFRNGEPTPVDIESTALTHIVVQRAPSPPLQPLAEIPLPPAALLDQVWTVTSIGGRPVSGSRPVTLSIAADQRATGSGGCNNYFAEASIDGNSIMFGPAAATRMACAPSAMAQEADYFAALAAVTTFELDDSLRLLDAAGVPLIGLVRNQEK